MLNNYIYKRRTLLCIFAAALLYPLFPLQALSASLWHPLHSPAKRTKTAIPAPPENSLRVNNSSLPFYKFDKNGK